MSSIRNYVYNMLAAATFLQMKKQKSALFLSLIFVNDIIASLQVNSSNELNNFTFKV